MLQIRALRGHECHQGIVDEEVVERKVAKAMEPKTFRELGKVCSRRGQLDATTA
jgi:hypothetical protein